MPQMVQKRIAWAVVAMPLLLAGHAQGDDIFWVDPGGGLFQDPSNWSRGVPGEGDIAGFNLATPGYTVSFDSDWTTTALVLQTDNVTFDLVGHVFTLNSEAVSTFIGDLPGAVALLTVTNGTLANNQLIIGWSNGATGELIVTGPGATCTSDSFIFVGDGGAGTFRIENGAFASCMLHSNIGSLAGATGEVFVDGPGSTWIIGTWADIGSAGDGNVTVSNGGVVSLDGPVGVGVGADSMGSLTVTGEDSRLDTDDRLVVGVFGEGAMLIADQGEVTSVGSCSIGDQVGAVGSATLTGAGSLWSIGSWLDVGSNAAGTLLVESGATVSTIAETTIGVAPAAVGDVTISGGFLFGGELRVGGQGAGTLLIENGGIVVTAGGRIGVLEGSVGTVKVSDSGQWLVEAGNLVVGDQGSGSLEITDGSIFSGGGFAGYVQDDDGSLLIEAPRRTPALDLLTGGAQLGGLLTVTLAEGFDPQVGEIIEILTAADGVSGEFDTVMVPTFNDDRIMIINYQPTAVTAEVVAGDVDFDDPDETVAFAEPNTEATGNLNADEEGFPDVIVTIPAETPRDNGLVQVFLNNGNGAGPGGGDGEWAGLVATDPVEVGREPTGVAVGFLNNDAFLDAVTANAGDNNLTLLINDGTGTLVASATIDVGQRPSAVAIADINIDGFDDIIVTNELDDTLWLLLNDGEGGFGETQQANTGGVQPIGICPEDLDNDKCTDVIGVNELADVGLGGQVGSVFIMFNNNGKLEPAITFDVGVNPKDLSVGDVDHDGLRDIVVVNADDATVSILINQGDGTFASVAPIPVGFDPRAIEAIDLDGDFDADLAIAADDEGIGPAVQVLRNLGVSPGEIIFDPPLAFSVEADPNFVVDADLNLDALNDLVTVNHDADGETGGSVTALINDPPPLIVCPWDLDGSGIVGPEDLIVLLGAWGEIDHPADFVDPLGVGAEDLIVLLGNWGPCPE